MKELHITFNCWTILRFCFFRDSQFIPGIFIASIFNNVFVSFFCCDKYCLILIFGRKEFISAHRLQVIFDGNRGQNLSMNMEQGFYAILHKINLEQGTNSLPMRYSRNHEGCCSLAECQTGWHLTFLNDSGWYTQVRTANIGLGPPTWVSN